ncbi:MAG: insulinase family protein, partial [Acidobacteria bacterium]|nr:insulinase family protein [Acidobacteriota bacterium]
MRQQRSRRRFGIALMVSVGLLHAPSGWLSDGLGQEVEPTVVTLDNGLTVIMLERHEQPTVAGGVFYNVGGADDPRGKSGIAHMFEHMLFKGSKIIGTSDYEAERPLIAEQDRLRDKMIAEMQKMRVRKRRGQLDDVLDPAQWTPAYTEMKKRYDELVEKQRAYIKNNELFNLYTTNGGARLNAGTMEDATMYFVELPAGDERLEVGPHGRHLQAGDIAQLHQRVRADVAAAAAEPGLFGIHAPNRLAQARVLGTRGQPALQIVCVNPAHLDPMTQRHNIRQFTTKWTHCKHGHPLSGANLYVTKNGTRCCRECNRRRQRRLGAIAHKSKDRDSFKYKQLPKGTSALDRIMAKIVEEKGPLATPCW